MRCKTGSSKCKKYFFLLIIMFLGFSIISYQNVFAIFPVWPFSFSLNDGGVLGAGFPTTPIMVSVTDPLASGTITVHITSSADPLGFDLTLIEGAPGVFTNTNLALMSDNALATMSSKVTITVFDDTMPLPIVQSLPPPVVFIFTDSDTAAGGIGISPTFTETGPDTNLYTATINFGVVTNSATNTLAAAPGDTFTVVDIGAGNWANGFILPNPGVGKGAIQATVGGTVTATYQGDSSSFVVGPYPGPGRGSGGLVNPGLVVDTPSSSSCNSDCSPPTLGLSKKLNRIVFGGFSYNKNPVDVDFYYTKYPLIVTNVGQENEAILKIFEDGGIQNIEHIELAFGLGKDQSFSESKATISIDRTRDGKEETNIHDPENVLDNVKVFTSSGSCGGVSTSQCLLVKILHNFREPLEFNMVATNVWDFKKNAWQNFYNHGIEIKGDSLNPQKTVMVAFGEKEMRGLYELTQIDKKNHLWIDEFDNVYENKGNDRYDRIYSLSEKKIYEKMTSHGCDRKCNWFNAYKLNQKLLAEITLNNILGGKNLQSDLDEPFSYTYDPKNRSEDPELQKSIIIEKLKAGKIADKVLK